jgi:hypothetical protein
MAADIADRDLHQLPCHDGSILVRPMVRKAIVAWRIKLYILSMGHIAIDYPPCSPYYDLRSFHADSMSAASFLTLYLQ